MRPFMEMPGAKENLSRTKSLYEWIDPLEI